MHQPPWQAAVARRRDLGLGGGRAPAARTGAATGGRGAARARLREQATRAYSEEQGGSNAGHDDGGASLACDGVGDVTPLLSPSCGFFYSLFDLSRVNRGDALRAAAV